MAAMAYNQRLCIILLAAFTVCTIAQHSDIGAGSRVPGGLKPHLDFF